MNLSFKALSGPAVAVLWVAVSLGDLLYRDPLMWHSAVGSLQSALSAAIILWPVVAGISAATTLRPMRPGLRDIVMSAPDHSRVRMVFSPVVGLILWALGGLIAASILCITFAGINGSWAYWGAYLALIPVAAGTLAMALLGASLGVLIPAWITPPTVAALVFLLPVAPSGVSRMMQAYVGADASNLTSWLPNPPELAKITVAYLTVAGAAFVIARARLIGSKLALTPALALLLVAAVSVSELDKNEAWYMDAPDSSWSCAAIPGSTRELCLPGEQARDVAATAQAMEQIDGRLGDAFPDGFIFRYGPLPDGLRTITIPSPFGSLDDVPNIAAETIASQVASCLEATSGEGSITLEQFYGFIGYLTGIPVSLEDTGEIPPLTLEQATSLLVSAQRGCSAE